MGMKIGTLLLLFTGLLISSCMNDPEFSNQPRIELIDVQFKEVGTISNADSLIIVLHFEDGDGNLGLDNSDEFSSGAYRRGDFFGDSNGNIVTIDHQEDLNLPPFELPYSCTNWLYRLEIQNFCSLAGIPEGDCEQVVINAGLEISDNQNSQLILDTLYFEPNPNHENMELTFFYQVGDNDPDFDLEDGDGRFKEFNWVTDIPEPCGFIPPLRFPILSDVNDNSPVEGTLKYGFLSTGLLPLFENETLKLRTSIKDRAFNESNTIVTDAFKLRDIQIN